MHQRNQRGQALIDMMILCRSKNSVTPNAAQTWAPPAKTSPPIYSLSPANRIRPTIRPPVPWQESGCRPYRPAAEAAPLRGEQGREQCRTSADPIRRHTSRPVECRSSWPWQMAKLIPSLAEHDSRGRFPNDFNHVHRIARRGSSVMINESCYNTAIAGRLVVTNPTIGRDAWR